MSEFSIYNAFFSGRWRAKLVDDIIPDFEKTLSDALSAAKQQVRKKFARRP
jgi:hypothetical protein